MSDQSRDTVVNGHSPSAPPIFSVDGAADSRGLFDQTHPEIQEIDPSQLSEAAFREAIENAVRSGLFVCDVDGHQTYVNRSFCKMVGWAEEELIGTTPPFAYWPEEEAERVQEAFDQMLSGDAPDNGFELKFVRKCGERFDAHVAVSPLISRNGSTQGWLASVTDISDQKRIETELRIREQQLRFALGAARVGTWDWDVASDEVQWSDNLETLHGLEAGALASGFSSLFDTIRADHRDRVKRIILGALEDGAEYHVEYPLVPRGGKTKWIEGFGSTLCDESGSPVRMAGICIDISDREGHEARRSDQETVSTASSFHAASTVTT